MQIDLSVHKCWWCEHDAAFLCPACHKFTCRDCYLGQTEEGCHHEKKQILESSPWNVGA